MLKVYGAEYSSTRTAEVTLQNGSRANLQFTADDSGNLVLQSGTINGQPRSQADLRNTAFALQTNGSKNVVLSENAGMGHDGGPPLDDHGSNSGGDPNGKPPLVPPPVPGYNFDYNTISTAKPGQASLELRSPSNPTVVLESSPPIEPT